jgi:hypothetical protein
LPFLTIPILLLARTTPLVRTGLGRTLFASATVALVATLGCDGAYMASLFVHPG